MEKYLYLRVTWPYNKKFNIVFQSQVILHVAAPWQLNHFQKLKLSGFCKTEVVLSWQWRRNGYLKLTIFVSVNIHTLSHAFNTIYVTTRQISLDFSDSFLMEILQIFLLQGQQWKR